MILGPNIIISCPHCRAKVQHLSILSGNSFGAIFWTDGKVIAPMMPNIPQLIACWQCKEIYWLKDAEILNLKEIDARLHSKKGRVEILQDFLDNYSPTNPPDYEPVSETTESIPYISEADEQQYYQAIKDKFYKDDKEEILLRILTWWKRNDTYRVQTSGHGKRRRNRLSLNEDAAICRITQECRENMLKLLELIKPEDEQNGGLAPELLREMGRFEEAKAALNIVKDLDKSLKTALIDLCGKGDICVRTFKPEDEFGQNPSAKKQMQQ